MRMPLSASALFLAATSLFPAPGLAGTANRVWVSGHGVDQAGCGGPVSPCRRAEPPGLR